MILLVAFFFLLGLAACYAIGRYVTRFDDLAQGAAVGLCGVGGLIFGLPDLWVDQFYWSLGLLFVYGVIGSLICRRGRRARMLRR
jgi:hypothetical protein